MPVQKRKRSSIAGKKTVQSRRKSGAKSGRAKTLGSAMGTRARKISARKGGLVKRVASAMSR